MTRKMTRKRFKPGPALEPRLAFGTRALLGHAQGPDCDNCDMPLIFGMELASGEQFSLDMLMLLKCLALAEAEGAIPPICMDWWNSVRGAYYGLQCDVGNQQAGHVGEKVYEFKLRAEDIETLLVDRLAFDEMTHRRVPWYSLDQRNDDGCAYGLCPACNNPVQLVGLYRALPHGEKPYGKHTAGPVAGLAFDKQALDKCPLAAGTGEQGPPVA